MIEKLTNDSIVWHLEGKLDTPDALAAYACQFGQATARILENARRELLGVRGDYRGATLTLYREVASSRLDFLVRAGNTDLMRVAVDSSGKFEMKFDNCHMPASYADAVTKRIQGHLAADSQLTQNGGFDSDDYHICSPS